jgi:hypothetical protein
LSYLLFAGGDYEERGGAHDLLGRYHTVESAMSAFKPKDPFNEWAHVLCVESLEVVWQFCHHCTDTHKAAGWIDPRTEDNGCLFDKPDCAYPKQER